MVLLGATAIALILANSALADSFLDFWNTRLSFGLGSFQMDYSIGGMLIPALTYLALQYGEPSQAGWGIPTATDIAFVVGCMAVLGKRMPSSLRVLLLSSAIADDIGAILVIAIAYTDTIDYQALLLGFVGIGAVVMVARLGVRQLSVYLLLGSLV